MLPGKFVCHTSGWLSITWATDMPPQVLHAVYVELNTVSAAGMPCILHLTLPMDGSLLRPD